MPLPLTWDILFYTVLIAEFVADYRSSWWIPYQVRCIILQDEASTLLQSAMSLGAAALADVGRAASYAPDIAIDLMPLQAALAAPAATTRGTSAFSRAQLSLNETRSLLQASIAAADTTLATTNPTTAGSVSLGVEQLAAVADASGQSSSLIAARALLQRTAANLTNASTLIVKSVTVAGDNLFRIAASYLGDATQWIRIAELNKISDPMLTGLTTLLIPDTDPKSGGGIAAQ